MAFVEGAECSSSFNPLSRLAKHSQNDHTLHRDRFIAKRPALDLQSMRSSDSKSKIQVNGTFNDFNVDASLPQASFGFDQPGLVSPPMYSQTQEFGPGWASEYQSHSFNNFESLPQTTYNSIPRGLLNQDQSSTSRFSEQSSGRGTRIRQANSMAYGRGPWFSAYPAGVRNDQSQEDARTETGMLGELEPQWDSMFSHLEESLQSQLSSPIPVDKSVDDIIRSVVDASLEEDKHWSRFDNPKPKTQLYDTMQINTPEPSYEFSINNTFLSHQSPFNDGLNILANGDNLSLAVLAFEAACQQNPLDVEAWRLLGSTQADNANESAAMHTLEEALKLAPNDLEILMGLAVSYTNNGYDGKAYELLERWILLKHPEVGEGAEPLDSSVFPSHHAQLEHVKNLFIAAARLTPEDGQIDTAVQVGLGVLCFSGESYQMAADCFSAALAGNEDPGLGSNTQLDLHILWNRLGAALANMGRYGEAIEAYQMALAINTNYVRANHNLAVLYHNIHEYTEAAEHSLEALRKHNASGPKSVKRVGSLEGKDINARYDHSEELYEVLRKILRQLNRWDLVEGVGPGMDVLSYRKEVFG